jgi:hypothetical protein
MLSTAIQQLVRELMVKFTNALRRVKMNSEL